MADRTRRLKDLRRRADRGRSSAGGRAIEGPSFRLFEIDVDELSDPGVLRDWSNGALIVCRSDGVPVGSAFVASSERPTDLRAVVDVRDSDPPPPANSVTRLSITVAVCTRDRPDLLIRCLTSINVAIAVADGEIIAEILVVDNASSSSATLDAARSCGAKAVREGVAGLDVARNRAVASSTGDVIAFVDDDVVVDSVWLRTLGRTFAANPGAMAVTGGVLAFRLDTWAQREFERCGGFFKGWTSGPIDDSTRSLLPFNPSIGVGCNMAFRRSALDRLGPFDEALDTGSPLAGGGDLDMLLRAVMSGPVFYEPSALVRHEHRKTAAQLRRQYLSWGKSWGAVLHKWYAAEPSHRSLIRRAGMSSLRHYVHEMFALRGRRYRRGHAVLMLLGFASGVTTAYPRSIRRMAHRRCVCAGTGALGVGGIRSSDSVT